MTIYWLALAAAISTSLIGQVLLKSGAANSVAAEGGFFDQLFRLPTRVGWSVTAARPCFTSSRCAASQ